MHPVYCDKYFNKPAMHVWSKKFALSRESVVEKKRLGRRAVLTSDDRGSSFTRIDLIDGLMLK